MADIDFNNIGTFTVTAGNIAGLPEHWAVLSQGVIQKEVTLAQYNVKEEAIWQQVRKALVGGFGTITIDLSGLVAILQLLEDQIVQLQVGTPAYNGVADLRTVTAERRFQKVIYTTLYHLTPGDGQGFRYLWNPSSVETADDFNVVQPDDISGSGRFEML